MRIDRQSLTPAYFEALYADDADPWRFATSDYERRKYAATLVALNGHEIHNAFEVGCSIGIFTRQLARRCHSLLAVDVAEQALEQARRNCEGLNQVRIERMQIPAEWPAEKFDLIVLSEVLYYLSPHDIRRTAERSLASSLPKGLILLVHWTGQTDYPCQGDEAVEHYIAACKAELSPLLQRQEPEYRLDLLARKS
jgi:cyclopropane fatty-acyl-phospholipid synthase-like methyltransferase